jgi:hypothetical protein
MEMFGELSDNFRLNLTFSGYFVIRGKLQSVSFRRSAADNRGVDRRGHAVGDSAVGVTVRDNHGGDIKWSRKYLRNWLRFTLQAQQKMLDFSWFKLRKQEHRKPLMSSFTVRHLSTIHFSFSILHFVC